MTLLLSIRRGPLRWQGEQESPPVQADRKSHVAFVAQTPWSPECPVLVFQSGVRRLVIPHDASACLFLAICGVSTRAGGSAPIHFAAARDQNSRFLKCPGYITNLMCSK